ncbi:MAG: 4Fe-4S dicluster domain-containing protein [Desulfatiglans sp.]|jgi:molybdopterin-containing oxidoreductase family iron-sulfur binding subunit|nr:4Fe-4S dicluster domain-containing protein [Thermodesulfobacteriota bacterium]MEE4353841.1 4Fe-4S dicluster domain-containing protein [Desulfatiglans sp.]
MGLDRRRFLKIAGLTTLFGLGGKAAIQILAPGEVNAAVEALPLTEGKRWAMVIDTNKMDEKLMNACIEACHHEHNVPDLGNPKEEIKWIWKEDYHHSFPGQQHNYISEEVKHRNFLLMCNHCSNPPCCRVCPTKSTWQREDGVVMMDPHRCIGCRFCMAACPFGARSFNWGDPRKASKEKNPDFPTNQAYPTRSKGVVEKCNFCAERLAKGELPVCVERANKTKKNAMIFGDLSDPDSDVRAVLHKHYTIRRKPELGSEPNLFFIV